MSGETMLVQAIAGTLETMKKKGKFYDRVTDSK